MSARAPIVGLLLLSSLSACTGDAELVQACPNIAIIKGLERAELVLSRDGVEANLDIRLGPIDGECLIDDDGVTLIYGFDIVFDNPSPFSFSELAIDYFVVAAERDDVIDKTIFATPPANLNPNSTVTIRETVEQRLVLEPGASAGFVDILIGLNLPSDIGLRQRENF